MSRVALVTGGTRGIGGAISLALKNHGCQVAANYGANDEAAQRFHEVTGIAVYKWDVSDFAACEAGVAQIEADLGPIDILVNNAGITRDGTLQKMTPDRWQAVLDTNLGSCFNLCHATFPGMRARKFGRVVNVGSINGQAGQYGQVNYAAAKSGIHGFTKALAQGRRAPRDHRERRRSRLCRYRHGARGAGGGAGEDRGLHPRRPARPRRGHRPARCCSSPQMTPIFITGFHDLGQRRPSHVLTRRSNGRWTWDGLHSLRAARAALAPQSRARSRRPATRWRSTTMPTRRAPPPSPPTRASRLSSGTRATARPAAPGVAAVEAAHGPVEILVNNAGTVSDNKFENMTDDQWQRVVRVNLDSVFYMSKAVYPGMMERRWGRIVQIGSMNGQAGQLNQVNYVAAKAGMHGFTKALAQEGAKHGITVNTVAPGYVDTYLMRNMPERIAKKIIEKSPIRRMGYEDEVAHAVLFLVDDKAAWTTGSTITMNGGTHMY